MANRVKVWRKVYGATIEAKNFASKTKAQLGFESTHPDVLVAKIRLNGSDN